MFHGLPGLALAPSSFALPGFLLDDQHGIVLDQHALERGSRGAGGEIQFLTGAVEQVDGPGFFRRRIGEGYVTLDFDDAVGGLARNPGGDHFFIRAARQRKNLEIIVTAETHRKLGHFPLVHDGADHAQDVIAGVGLHRRDRLVGDRNAEERLAHRAGREIRVAPIKILIKRGNPKSFSIGIV